MKFKIGDRVRFKKTSREVGFFDDRQSWFLKISGRIGEIVEIDTNLDKIYMVKMIFDIGQCVEPFGEDELMLVKDNNWTEESL